MLSARRLLLLLTPLLVVTVIIAGLRGGDGATLSEPSLRTVSSSATPEAATAPTATTGPSESRESTPTAPPTTAVEPTVGPKVTPVDLAGFTYAAGENRTFGRAPHRRFAVAVEQGAGVDIGELVAFVDETLGDQRSWIGDTVTGFERVDPGTDDLEFTLVVATPATVDRLCAPLNTAGIYSCGNNGWIALNLDRWTSATDSWPADLETYRRYLVNHEVGHYVLGPDHPSCPSPNSPAPIMMQQTIDLGGCAPNGWVYPD